jgi:hypothetical protein
MKASEILRKLADVIDSVESEPLSKSQQAIQAVAPQEVPTQDQTPNLIAVQVPNKDEADAGVFVPPLQAKLEILKKSEGIPNVYDSVGQEDELSAIKKHAGLTTAQKEASEDNDITG